MPNAFTRPPRMHLACFATRVKPHFAKICQSTWSFSAFSMASDFRQTPTIDTKPKEAQMHLAGPEKCIRFILGA